MAERQRMYPEQSGSVPVPDPTKLTTEALTREVAALKELVITRLDSMDKAMDIFSANLTRAPTEVDKQISHLKSLVEQKFEVMLEKFTSVQTQFKERDVRGEQSEKKTEVAVGAALQAAKEAVGEQNKSNALSISKMEAAFIKQIDGISELIRTTAGGWERQMSDLKERVTRIESEYVGRTKEVTTQQTSSMNTVSIIGLVLGSLIGIGGLILAFVK